MGCLQRKSVDRLRKTYSVDLVEIPLGKSHSSAASHLDTGARLATPKKRTLNTWKGLFVKEKNLTRMLRTKF